MKRLAVIPLVLAIAACASNPNKIEATYVSPSVYKNYTCDELLADKEAIERQVETKTGKMKKAQTRDTVALTATMILFWPAVFFMKGKNGGSDARLASLKGKYEAIETMVTQKRCV
jgi:hypothetical protein